MLSEIVSRARTMLPDEPLNALSHEVLGYTAPSLVIYEFLSRWCVAASKPLVLLIDEIDSFVGDSLLSV